MMADQCEARELIDHVLIVVGNDDLHAAMRRWNSSGSTLPPESTATTTLFLTSSLPAISAASATAPPASATSFNERTANATAAATSSSVAETPSPTRELLISNVSAPGVRAISASQIVPVTAGCDSRCPLRNERA